MRVFIPGCAILISTLVPIQATSGFWNKAGPSSGLCIEQGESCGASAVEGVGTCCGAYKCVGTPASKTCMEPPVCLQEGLGCGDETPCCDGMVCQELGSDEEPQCQMKNFGFNSGSLPSHGRFLEGPINDHTTKIPGARVNANVACSAGTNHILTFDGLKYDCHGEGEFVLAKSTSTRREIQARYQHVAANKAASTATGFAIQDEGDTPLVQVSIPALNSSAGEEMYDGCKLQLFVDGVQRNFADSSGNEGVVITHENNHTVVKYTESEMEVSIRYFECRVSMCLNLPDTDATVGLLGTASNSTRDDWTNKDGTEIDVPAALADRLRKPAYDFCTQNFCVNDKDKSLFVYPEEDDGLDFDYYEKCELPFGSTIEQYLFESSQEMIDVCQGDVQCLIDVDSTGTVAAAEELTLVFAGGAMTCNLPGGECDESMCCYGECVDFGGFAGKQCSEDRSHRQCIPEYGSCGLRECCEGFVCKEIEGGESVCVADSQCTEEYMSCTGDEECCDDTLCLDNQRGSKVCRRLPLCAADLDDCSLVGCCGGLTCVDNELGGKQCKGVPDCWEKENGDCGLAPCCDGMTCIQDGDRSLCKDLPEVVGLGDSCKWVACNEREPLECVDIVDFYGREDKQCRYTSAEAEITAFSDINSNGIFDENEPGIPGVTFRIVRASSNNTDQFQDYTTDALGKAVAKGLPRGTLLRVQVASAPTGAIPTFSKVGSDESIDSDLLDNDLSEPFEIGGEAVWTQTSLGYRMPVDATITVFNDLNSNGVQDEGELGLKGVSMHLLDPEMLRVSEQGNRGTAHEELITDDNGIVTFTKVPQGVKLRARVTESPPGGLMTAPPPADDTALGSELRSDGITEQFEANDRNIAIAYRMPETVTVRVWNDANENGIQDEGEAGLEDVKLRLVQDVGKTPLSDYRNGGSAHSELTTDADGLVHFTKVPQDLYVCVQVTQKPPGSIPTFANSERTGLRDSNLRNNGYSDPFMLKEAGAPFSEIDLGYRIPSTMKVRVWDDANANGIEDEGEEGIQGVEIRVVMARNKAKNVTTAIPTGADGYATFTDIPRDQEFRIQVMNAPEGATITKRDKGTDEGKDSDLYSTGYTSAFFFTGVKGASGISLGYQMPRDMRARVWDDANHNGIQDEGELGIEGVKLRLIKDSDRSTYMDGCNGIADRRNLQETDIQCRSELVTDEDGFIVFPEIPKGTTFRVMVINEPVGATRTIQKRHGSSLGDDGTTRAFDMAEFSGYSEIAIGYSLPDDVEVRVWDDVNANGVQDDNELGVQGVEVYLIGANGGDRVEDQSNGGTAHHMLTTDEEGLALFTKVPIDGHYRVKVANTPAGALRTSLGQGELEEKDSDLRSDGTTTSFYLRSFSGSKLGTVDIGYRMPKDVQVRVWDDVNGDGSQDEGEGGIGGVKLRLIDSKTGEPFENIGGGSTAHELLISDENGIVNFRKVPKGRNLHVKVINAPPGSVTTLHNRGGSEGDSDLNKELESDSFNLNSFSGLGAFGQIDLGFRMPKTMVVRVWNDRNRNGIQEEGEEGIKNVEMRLLNSTNLKDLRDMGQGGTAAERVKTDALGRATFTKVPQGVRLRVEVTRPPQYAVVTARNAGGEDELDSDLSPSGITDSFQLPSDITSLYSRIDIGYVLTDCTCSARGPLFPSTT